MTINFRAPEVTELKPRITVLGVGGAGGNAVNNMITAKLEGVSFVVANTDAQALHQSKANRKIQLGAKLTEGLGAGAKPEIGRGAAEESIDEILEHLSGSHMVFVCAGMGGGTGTGAAPVIARAVRELGILTVGVVTKPFHFEGDKRMKSAERGIDELQNFVDTLIVIPNQNLFRVANERTTFAQAFSMADEVLHSGVRGITDLIVMPGLINRDFADIRTVMSEMGKAMMGTGEMEGEGRALRAAEAAISNPLLDDVSMKGARAVLVNVTGGPDLMLFEVDEAVNRIRAEVDCDANILFGSALLENMEGRVRVSVVATGIDAESCTPYVAENVQRLHVPRRRMESEAPMQAAAPAPRMSVESSAVGRMMDNLAMQLETHMATPAAAAEPVVRREPAPVIPVPPPKVQMEEPLVLGGADAPMIQEPVVHTVTLRVEPRPEAQPKRRRFGLFGLRRMEREEYPVEPRLEATPVQPRQSASAPRQNASNAAQPTSQPAPGPASAARPVAEPPRPRSPSRDDLFAGVSEDDRFEIPAFLRRQVNTGG
jgi:cell division protein FtsZ